MALGERLRAVGAFAGGGARGPSKSLERWFEKFGGLNIESLKCGSTVLI